MEWFVLIILTFAMVLSAIGTLGVLTWVVEHEFEPAIKVEGIGVSIHDGVVTHNGSVGRHTEKVSATPARKRLIDPKGGRFELMHESEHAQMLQAPCGRKGSAKTRKLPTRPS